MNIYLLQIKDTISSVYPEETGICSIASYLREKSYPVWLKDFKDTENDMVNLINDKPDFIGIPVYYFTLEKTMDIVQKIRKRLPSVFICLGGSQGNLSYKELLETYGTIDAVVFGEGEETTYEIIKAIQEKKDFKDINGVAYRRGDEIVVNDKRGLIRELDTIPFIARDFLKNSKNKIALMSTSRGCFTNCSFCTSRSIWEKWRGRSIKNIIEELKEITQKYGVYYINFIDSSMEDPNQDRMIALSESILENDLDILYQVNFRAELQRKLKDETLQLMKKSGLVAGFVGIESGNDDDLKLYNKVARTEDNIEMYYKLKKNGLANPFGFINFNPYTDMEKLRKNITFLKQIENPIQFFTILMIYKNNPLFHKIKNDGLIKDEKSGVVEYDFKDKTITTLHDYFKNVFTYTEFASFDMYTGVYSIFHLAFYRRIMEDRNLKDCLELINEYEGVKRDANEYIYALVVNLLDTYETEQTMDALIKMEENMEMKFKFTEYTNKLSKYINKLNYKLFKNGLGDKVLSFS